MKPAFTGEVLPLSVVRLLFVLVLNLRWNERRGGFVSVGGLTATIEARLSVSLAADGMGGRSLSLLVRDDRRGASNSGKGARFWIGGRTGGVGSSDLLIRLLEDA